MYSGYTQQVSVDVIFRTKQSLLNEIILNARLMEKTVAKEDYRNVSNSAF